MYLSATGSIILLRHNILCKNIDNACINNNVFFMDIKSKRVQR